MSRRAVLVSIPGVWLAFTASACAAPEFRLDKDHTAATVPVGGRVIIDLGMTNSSVGYHWVRVEGPGSHLADVPKEPPAEPRPVGGASEQVETFTAVSTGTATVIYEFRVRRELSDRYELNGQRMTFTVTVT
ncbi:protease inhibitor I42 family protein [Arthrobacter sp. RCC_34]|uniref:protease inhibitor I42 family protein n=1 Tax=Arthrobacter sp. RCC_34 TaxID=3239230 RepID=UPI00352625D8